MKSESARPVRTFATFRIAGDELVPDQVTKLLKIVPSHAHAKGERFSAGPRSQNLEGRTGIWYFSTDRLVASEHLTDHLSFLVLVLAGAARSPSPAQWTTNLLQLGQFIERHAFRAALTCFWDGPVGSKLPTIPRELLYVSKIIHAEIETDFDTEEEPPQPAMAHY